jgi:3-oxoacyl-[acyl-carrier protein] reductase
MVLHAGFMTGAVVRLDGGYCLGGEPVPEMPEGVVKPGESTFGGSAGG